MTREQAQSLVAQLGDVRALLSNTITSLTVALEFFDHLQPGEQAWLQMHWQEQQLIALHRLSNPLDIQVGAPSLPMLQGNK